MTVTNEQQARLLWTLFSAQKWDDSKELFHPNFVAEWPQSRERFISAFNFVEMNRAYPGNHKMKILQVIPAGDTVVTAVYIHADTGQEAFATSVFEFKDGKIFKMTEYWGEPSEPPAWRAKWNTRF